jgi:hypothetical protein
VNPRMPEPRVGIVWLFNGRLIVDSSPIAEAEPYAEGLTHARSHLDHWASLQRNGEVPADVEYEEPPRGRVTYYPARNQFVLYADPCTLGKKAVLRQIMRAFSLPAERTTTSADLHYRCAKCLRRSPE